MTNLALPLVAARDALAPQTELLLNEFIPFNNDWCDPPSAAALLAEHRGALGRDPGPRAAPFSAAEAAAAACPDWKNPRSQGTKINRQTLGWNAAAAAFAYGYVRLAREGGYKAVGADQLVGGPWRDARLEPLSPAPSSASASLPPLLTAHTVAGPTTSPR